MNAVLEPVSDWLMDRRNNARTIAGGDGVKDPAAWMEDAAYFDAAIKACAERDEFRSLLEEWDLGMYDGKDFLRRVRLALHGNKGLKVIGSNIR